MFNATPLLKTYASYRRSQINALHPFSTQEAQLLSLVRRAANTTFGRDHRFGEIRSVADYRARVPLRTYERMWNEYWKPTFPRLHDVSWPGLIRYFAVSSGTSSGTTKYIPYTDEMTASNRKGAFDLLTHHLTHRPTSKIFGGRCFMLGGSTELVEMQPGIFSGDLSGIAVKTMPWWARRRYFPPEELALLKNWEEKIERFSQESLAANIRMISGVPSWMLIFFKRLFELRPAAQGRLAGVYPNLELVTHGGVQFSPYLEQFKSLLSGSHAELREVYPASEGFIAVADRGYGEGLRLMLDNEIFFEFVPVEELDKSEPIRHHIGEIEVGVNYAVVMTTCAGLWSYIIGDTVKFVDRNPPRLLVSGRTSYYLSAFGEHLIAEEIDDGVSTAATAAGITVTDYSVGALYPKHPGELGGHLFIIEASAELRGESLNSFVTTLDARLQKRNEDYEAHRARGFGLNPPKVFFVPPGTFAAWMKSRGKLGGQNKVPRIMTNRELFDGLRSFVGAVTA